MEYELIKSSKILDIRDGTHDSPKYLEKGYPLITSKNLKDGKILLSDLNYISKEDFDSINKRSKVDKGDILYSMIGTIGNYSIIEEEPIFAIKNVALFKFNNAVLYNRYFFYLLGSPFIVNQILNQQKGGTQKFVTLTILRNLQIPLPDLSTQQKVAALLDKADELRQYNKQLIQKYDALTQSLFLYMFGDPVRNEKGWEKLEFNKLCDFKRTSVQPEKIIEGENYIPLESIEKQTGNILNIDKVAKGNIKSSKFYFTKDYILYGKLRPYLNKVATPDFSGVCSTDIIPIKPIKEKTNKFFIVQNMRSSGFVAFCSERTSGANLPRISPKEVEKFQVINPPIILQNQFAERVQLIEQQKEQAQQALQKSEDLFNSLLQKAFKGELVTEYEF